MLNDICISKPLLTVPTEFHTTFTASKGVTLILFTYRFGLVGVRVRKGVTLMLFSYRFGLEIWSGWVIGCGKCFPYRHHADQFKEKGFGLRSARGSRFHACV